MASLSDLGLTVFFSIIEKHFCNKKERKERINIGWLLEQSSGWKFFKYNILSIDIGTWCMREKRDHGNMEKTPCDIPEAEVYNDADTYVRLLHIQKTK